MNYKKFTKITSGTLLLSATSALASQAQGGVVGTSGLAQNGASIAFLQNGAYGSESSWNVLKVFGVSVVVGILLLVGIAMYRSNKNQKRELPQKEKIEDTKLKPEKISDEEVCNIAMYRSNKNQKRELPQEEKIEDTKLKPEKISDKEVCNKVNILISEIQNLKPKDFFKGKDFLNDAKERNNKLVDFLKAKSISFSNQDLDKLFAELKVLAGNMLDKEVEKRASYTKKIGDYQSFFNKAKEAYGDLKKALDLSSEFLVRPRSFVSEDKKEEWEKVAKEKVVEVRFLLKKWYSKDENPGLYFYFQLDEDEYDKVSKTDFEKNINSIYKELRSDTSPYLFDDRLLLKLKDYLSTLANDIKEIEKKLKKWEAPLDTAIKEFEENRNAILKALNTVKEKKSLRGMFGNSNQIILNEADGQ